MKRVTISDVAREAGLSQTTVSHSLNGLGQVNPETRAWVKEVAERLNYHPNTRAQKLRKGRSNVIALLSSMTPAVSAQESRLGFFTELAVGTAETALLRGYYLLLVPPSGENDILYQLDIDGAILAEPAPEDPLQKCLEQMGLPYVTVGGASGPTNVDLHHTEIAQLLLTHLHGTSARHVGMLLGTSGRESQRIFEQQYNALAERAGFKPVIAQAAEDGGETAGYEATAQLLSEHPEIEALCVPIDAFASGAVRAAHEAGRSVGKDLLLATRYNGVRAQTCQPPLTAVDLHLNDVSRAAVDCLLQQLGNHRQGAEASTSASSPELIVRPSTCG